MTEDSQQEPERGWYEEYRCGCVSEIVKRKKDLLGYCRYHGDNWRGIFRKHGEWEIQNDRSKP